MVSDRAHKRSHTVELLRGSASAAVAKLATTGVSFAFNLMLARALGVEQTGIFFLAIALVTIAGVLSRLGLDKAALKSASQHIAVDEWSGVKAVYLQALLTVTLSASVFVAVLYFFSPWLANNVFDKPDLIAPMRYMALVVLPLSLLNVHAQFLKSIRYVGVGLFLQNAAITALSLVALLVMSGLNTAAALAPVYLVAALISAGLTAAIWLRLSGLGQVRASSDYNFGALFDSSASLYVVSLVNQIIIPWAALILLGVWGSESDVGQFGIARRMAMLINFAYLAVESISAPKFAELFRLGDTKTVEHVARRATGLMVLVAAPVSCVLIFAPRWTMEWFGAEFVGGAAALMILAVGQFFNAATGSVANLLIMSGREALYRNATLASGGLNLILCGILIPVYGSVGAAVATAASVVFLNLLSLYLVWARLNFIPLPGIAPKPKAE